jgi:WD40 repeat protein
VVLIWDTESGAALLTLTGEGDGLWSLAWSPDGAQLAAGSTGGKIFFWQMAAFDVTPAVMQRHLAWVSDLAWHADSTRLLSGSGDTSVVLWDVVQRNSARLAGHEQPVRGVAFSPDATRAASGGMEGALIVWDTDPLALEEVIAALEGHAGGVTAVDWSPDGQSIATGSEDGTVLIWPAPARE